MNLKGMMMQDITIYTIIGYALQAASVLLYIAGISIAVKRWQRHPVVSMLITISSGVGLCNYAFGTFGMQYFSRTLESPEMKMQAFQIISVIHHIISLMTGIAVLVAVFYGRKAVNASEEDVN